MRSLIILLVVGIAHAAPENDARRRFDNGQRLVAERRYVEALAEFSAGYELSKKPLFLFNMAECARSAGDAEQARDLYAQYLVADPDGKLAETARTRLDELGGPPSPKTTAPTKPAPPPPAATQPPPATSAPPPPVESPVVEKQPSPVESQPTPVWKRKGLWIGLGVGTALVIVVGAVGGYYGAHESGCSGACVSFR